jgi:hypothetical protein
VHQVEKEVMTCLICGARATAVRVKASLIVIIFLYL